MKNFTLSNQGCISGKYKLTVIIPEELKQLVITDIRVPDITEIIGTIYLFVNPINGKVYVGQTYTKYYERFGKHFVDTFTMQDDVYFHRAIRKYGGNCFDKYIIWQSECLDKTEENIKLIKDELNNIEIEFIKYFHSNESSYGYNSTIGGNYLPDSAYSEEALDKKRIEQKLHPHSLAYDKHPMAKSVLQYSLDGDLLKEGSCASLAKDNIGCNVNPGQYTSGGYIGIGKNEFTEELLQNRINGVKENYSPVEIIYQFDLNMNLIAEYGSFGEVERKTGFSKEAVCHSVGKGIAFDSIGLKESQMNDKEAIAYKLLNNSKKYVRFHKPIYQIFLNGDVIKRGNCLDDIYKSFPKSEASINKCLNGKLNFYNNCIGIYEDELTDDIVEQKINAAKKRHKSLVNDILSGKVTYNPDAYLTSKHNTRK